MKNRVRPIGLCSLVMLSLTVGLAGWSPARAENWPRFRGPGGQGISSASSIPAVITRDQYRWRVELPGGGPSSPVIWEDRIFLTCEGEDGARQLVCLSAADGKVLWTYADRFQPHRQHVDNSFVSATPVVDADRVYLWWSDGESYRAAAVDHQGVERWHRTLGTFASQHGTGASPILAEGVLILTNEHEGEGSWIAGLDPATGETRWKLARESSKASYSTPAERVAEDGSTEIICTSTSHALVGLDPRTGTVRWSSEGPWRNRCVSSPAISGDVVLATAGAGGIGREAYVLRLGQAPLPLYEPKRNLPYVVSSVAHAGMFFLWSDPGVVSCLQADSGEVLWSETVCGKSYASPLCIDGRIYGIDRAGLMVVLAADRTFSELGRHQFEKGTDATPAVAHDRLYVRLDDLLICIGS